MSETSSHKNAKTRGLSGSKTEVQIRGNRWLDARGHRNALLDKPAEKISPTQTKLARCGTSFLLVRAFRFGSAALWAAISRDFVQNEF